MSPNDGLLMTASPILPTTLAGASIVIQVCLLFITYIALYLLSKSYSARGAAIDSYSSLVAWLLLTLVTIVMGEDFYAMWGPILGSLSFPKIPRDYAFFAVFILDIIFTTILILRTGGTKKSPFTSVLFLLPSLAIFLREPVSRFLFYSVAVGLVYVIALRTVSRVKLKDFDRGAYVASPLRSRADEAVDDRATVWTNITCLALVTLIGYITHDFK